MAIFSNLYACLCVARRQVRLRFQSSQGQRWEFNYAWTKTP